MLIRWRDGAVEVYGEATGHVVWRLEPWGIPTAAWEADVRAVALLHEIRLYEVNRVLRQAMRGAQEVAGGRQGRDAPTVIRSSPVTAQPEPDFVGPEP